MESSRDDFVIAIRSAFLKKENKQKFSLLGLIFFSIIFLILGNLNFKPINYIKSAIKEIVYRGSFIVSGPENFIKNNYLIAQNHLSLYNKNEKNKSELEYLRSKNLSNEITDLENIKYKKLLDDYFIKDNEVYGKVLIDKQSPFLRSVILNKGSKNNVKLGMIVMDEIYLVGKIVEVNYFTSRVLLLSDINSKIPVSLQPGDIQAIVSGKGKREGILQYIKEPGIKENNEELLVSTSGAGGLFKSGIPVGKILKENNDSNEFKIVNFYKDFSQLKYVKIISFSKEKTLLDQPIKEEVEVINSKIEKINERKEVLKILLEQKKIADETRVKIEEENNFLKEKIIRLQNEMLITKKIIKKNIDEKKQMQFNELNILYGKKCKKTIFNKLYTVGTTEYTQCILNKGLKKN